MTTTAPNPENNMPKFSVLVSKQWTEYGTIQVEADDELDARELVRDLLSSDDDEFEWDPAMDPGQTDIEEVTPVDD